MPEAKFSHAYAIPIFYVISCLPPFPFTSSEILLSISLAKFFSSDFLVSKNVIYFIFVFYLYQTIKLSKVPRPGEPNVEGIWTRKTLVRHQQGYTKMVTSFFFGWLIQFFRNIFSWLKCSQTYTVCFFRGVF